MVFAVHMEAQWMEFDLHMSYCNNDNQKIRDFDSHPCIPKLVILMLMNELASTDTLIYFFNVGDSALCNCSTD